ncbi:MAG: hypothetical protein MHM6MM_005378 [Cercozoa sp. M6MM]
MPRSTRDEESRQQEILRQLCLKSPDDLAALLQGSIQSLRDVSRDQQSLQQKEKLAVHSKLDDAHQQIIDLKSTVESLQHALNEQTARSNALQAELHQSRQECQKKQEEIDEFHKRRTQLLKLMDN